MKSFRKSLVMLILMTTIITLTGCAPGGNQDFEYMKQRSIIQVTIQSTRDKKYKFSVTDKSLIKEIYTILSNATVVEGKSELQPDYILEIYESPTEVKRFNYVAGLDKTDGANLYNDDNYYIVSKRLDSDIIKNFTNMRKPISFEEVYYNSILNCLKQYKSNTKTKEAIGVDIINDKEISKFQISTDIEEFKHELTKDGYDYVNSEEEVENQVVAKIKTQGYTSKKYKAIVDFENKVDGTTLTYYINSVYSDGQWTTKITDTKPENF